MTKGAKYTEKYWFAVGYYHRRHNAIGPIAKDLIDSYMNYFNVDIEKEYQAGIKAAEKDIESGID